VGHARRAAAAAFVTGALVAVVVAAGAAPASAHGIGVDEPTNYETRILTVQPPVAGLQVRVIETGRRLEVANRSGSEVVVSGYDGEPYLRIGRAGVFENRRSPSWWVNRSLRPPLADPPPGISDTAPPHWVRVSAAPVARFHWHEAHWMAPDRPPAAQRDPGHVHVVARWQLALHAGTTDVTVHGDLRWVPSRTPGVEVAVMVVLGAAVIVAGRGRHWRWALVVALAALAAAETAHVGGMWNATHNALTRRVGQNVYSFAGIALGAWAAAELARRRDPRDVTPLALLAAIVLTVAGGLTDLATLTRPILPTTLPPAVARMLVAAVVGTGLGAVAVAATHLARADQPTTGAGRARTS
jgi:hypothetical protein